LPGESSGRDRSDAVALLGALCFFLSAIEYLVPRPLPFMRLGLANLPLLLALRILGPGDFFRLTLLKVAGQSLLGGTFLSFLLLFSLVGSFGSALLMYGLSRLPERFRPGFVGLGCAGAMASNAGQLLVAGHGLLFGDAARLFAPPFLAGGFLTGIALGLFCGYFCLNSRWYAGHLAGLPASATLPTVPARPLPETRAAEALPGRKGRGLSALVNADELFVAGILMAALFLFGHGLPVRALRFLFFCLCVPLLGRRNNYPATLVLILSVVVFGLLVPHGKVLFVVGPLTVTSGSLTSSLDRALTLSGLMMLSRACVKADLRLPGTFGSLLARSLCLLELMRANRPLRKTDKAGLTARLDRMLLELEAGAARGPEPGRDGTGGKVRNPRGILLLAGLVLATALLGLV